MLYEFETDDILRDQEVSVHKLLTFLSQSDVSDFWNGSNNYIIIMIDWGSKELSFMHLHLSYSSTSRICFCVTVCILF